VIEIPGNQGQDGASYRLDYYPPIGTPKPNTTYSSQDVGPEIKFHDGLPGTKYNFWLYYKNVTHQEWLLTWTVTITTAPDPPSNLSVSARPGGKNAVVSWGPPFKGNYTSFKLKVLGLSDTYSTNRSIPIEDNQFQYQLRDLTPGATYQIQAYTVFDGKESVAYTSRNFTTSKLALWGGGYN
jgi:cadherin 5 type 2 (VE-cadherin)